MAMIGVTLQGVEVIVMIGGVPADVSTVTMMEVVPTHQVDW